MRTDLDLAPTYDFGDACVSDSDLIGFNGPSDIVHDPMLTLARTRQLLAHRASDVHAVAGTPAPRAYALGPAVSIALCQLDDMVDLTAIPPAEGQRRQRLTQAIAAQRWTGPFSAAGAGPAAPSSARSYGWVLRKCLNRSRPDFVTSGPMIDSGLTSVSRRRVPWRSPACGTWLLHRSMA